MTKAHVRLLLGFACVACAWIVLHESNAPPSDEVLIKGFRDKRLAYERLRDLLLSDGTILSVADWGVMTAGSPLTFKPPIAEMSAARYDQYLTLLKETGGDRVGRSESGLREACICVWAIGFAGDTQHESVCWLPNPPADQVSRLDEIEERPTDAHGERSVVYRHLDGNWYLERDGW